jgi:fatty acid-binding protein DegV
LRPVKIFSDSTCDLSPELIQRHNIGIVPLYVNFDKLSFKDGVDLDSTGLIRKVKETGKLPKTSAPTAADFTAEFKKYLDQDMDILHTPFPQKYQLLSRTPVPRSRNCRKAGSR